MNSQPGPEKQYSYKKESVVVCPITETLKTGLLHESATAVGYKIHFLQRNFKSSCAIRKHAETPDRGT